MTKQEIVQDYLEFTERVANYFYKEDLMIQSKKYEERKLIADFATSLAIKLKGELK